MHELPFKRIAVIGLGYIGLPTAAIFASRKVEVVGVDVNKSAVDIINAGQIHIIEPDLDAIVCAAVGDGYLRATMVPEPAEAFLIAVPTPFKGDNHEPDLSFIQTAANNIAPFLEAGNLIILESTSPVGATEAMAGWLAEARPDLSFPQDAGQESDIRVAYCPERVLPGKVMKELISNDRVIGGMTLECSERARSLYEIFVEAECVIASGPRVAEMAKLTENSFRDVNIAFANELSLICDSFGMDTRELISLSNRHPRVDILQPGPGVGGHCIAVDPWFIVSSAPEQARLIRCAREVNDSKPEWVLDKIRNEVDSVSRPIILYGATFKANIDDTRESPSYEIICAAARQFNDVFYVEPNVAINIPNAKQIGLEEALKLDAIHVGLVAHEEFKHEVPDLGLRLDFAQIWEV